jgi:hypothetical protein
MTRPGDRLRAWASRLFDADTMERLIDPVIADLQVEYEDASRAGRNWRRRLVRVQGYVAVMKVATRTLQAFLAVTFAVTLLLEVPPLHNGTLTLARAVYLVPQALVVAIPIALTLVIAWIGPAARTWRSLKAMLVAGVVCSIVAFALCDWGIPAANQSFRVSMAREHGMPRMPQRGPAEMTLGELHQQMNSAKAMKTVRSDWRMLEFTFHWRFAFACASLALTMLVVALHRCGAPRLSMRLGAAPIVLVYYVLMFVGREYAIAGRLVPPAVGAWMPVITTALVAAAIATLGSRRQVMA